MAFMILMFSLLFIETCQGGFIVAYAGPCCIARLMDNRPVIGYVNYCPTVSWLAIYGAIDNVYG